jgi:hypothetical protein
MDRRSLFSSIGCPGTRPCEGNHRLWNSFHRCDSFTPSHSYFAVALPKEGWTLSHPGSRDGTSSSPSLSMWRLKSTDASRDRMTSSPRLNSSMIFATNTQVASGRRTTVICTKASFKIGRDSPDVIYKSYCVSGSLSGSRAVMSGLAIVTGAPVSTVTRHAFPPVRPSACRLSWQCFSDTLCA